MTPTAVARDGGGPRWDRPGIPRKGWGCLDVEDHDSPDFTCELCGYDSVRYVHVMTHPEHPGELRVGCVCAGHLEGDYAAPRERERRLRNLASRRARLAERHRASRALWSDPARWAPNARGNYTRRALGRRITVFPDPARPGAWKAVVGDRFGTRSYPDPFAALRGVFDHLFPLARLQADGRSRVRFPGERGFR